jgi:hypothetical protein
MFLRTGLCLPLEEFEHNNLLVPKEVNPKISVLYTKLCIFRPKGEGMLNLNFDPGLGPCLPKCLCVY